jgi:magnesium-transporting ATPase (P-type)
MRQLALVLIGDFLINGSFSFWQEYRDEQALVALRRLLPQRIKAVRDEGVQKSACLHVNESFSAEAPGSHVSR